MESNSVGIYYSEWLTRRLHLLLLSFNCTFGDSTAPLNQQNYYCSVSRAAVPALGDVSMCKISIFSMRHNIHASIYSRCSIYSRQVSGNLSLCFSASEGIEEHYPVVGNITS